MSKTIEEILKEDDIAEINNDECIYHVKVKEKAYSNYIITKTDLVCLYCDGYNYNCEAYKIGEKK